MLDESNGQRTTSPSRDTAIEWKAIGTDGKECPLLWEPILAVTSTFLIGYDPDKPFFSVV